jgi:predicted Zn finger-like uncharacterized protein
MRLVCPNCEAQYEVDDDLIPDEGREVQCASCGTTWFQEKPAPVATTAFGVVAAPARSDEEERARIRAAVRDELAAQERDVMARPAPAAEPVPQRGGPAAPPATMGRGGQAPRPAEAVPEVDEEEILRTLKAELADLPPIDDKAPARSAKRSVIAAAANAGLDPKELRDEVSRARKGNIDPKELSGSLLPDFSDAQELFVERRSRRGGAGFLTGLGLAAALAGAYVLAEPLAKAVPAAGPVLLGYAGLVDEARTGVETGASWAWTTASALIDEQLQAASSTGN